MRVTSNEHTRHAPAPEMERKSTPVRADASGVLGIDEAEGLVTAIVSVTAIEDHVKDVIHPGSYAATLNNRRPKVVEHHDWKNPVGRVEEVKELPPGHPDLPEKTPDGKPWPSEAGALAATMRFNLDTQAGRDAFSNVKFYSETNECEWSIGYRVPPGGSKRSRDGVRQIKAIDLYEISFVLFGAAPHTATLAVKDDQGAHADELTGPAAETPSEGSVPPAEPPGDAAPTGGRDVDHPRDAPEDDEEDGDGEDGGSPPAADTVSHDDPAPSDDGDGDGEDTEEGAEEGAEEGGEARPLDSADDEIDWDGIEVDPLEVDWEELDRVVDAIDGSDDLTDPASADAPDLKPDPADEDDEEGDDGEVSPEDDAKTLQAQPVFDAEIKRAFSPGKRRDLAKRGIALPDGSYPIANVADLKNAIKAFGRASNKSRVKSHILKRARALGRTDLLPDDWTSRKADAAAEVKGSSASLDRSPRKNWVENTGNLPPYVREVARSIHQKRGIPLEQAIPIAISRIKRWARGGDDVKADTKAKAAKALAQWNALKAKAKARRNSKADAAGGQDADVVESTSYPYLPGTFEETRAALAKALTGRARPGRGGEPLVTIDATWTDRAVATWFPPGEPGEARSYEVPYRLDDEGKVWLGEPTEVQLTVDGGALDEAPFSHAGAVEALAEELKTYLLHEGKAGRVLSQRNANHLRGAVEQLVAILRTAGIKILTRDEDLEPEESEPIPAPESTAPSAQPDAMVKVDPMLRAKALKAFAAAQD